MSSPNNIPINHLLIKNPHSIFKNTREDTTPKQIKTDKWETLKDHSNRILIKHETYITHALISNPRIIFPFLLVYQRYTNVIYKITQNFFVRD